MVTAVLHVTNGDSTVATMERARLTGVLLPWRDVLHEGPVRRCRPASCGACARSTSPPSARRRRRRGGGPRARDERLSTAIADGEPVVLWFEHDLYDQLQLVQILAGLPARPEPVELICVGSFPGRPGFAGLGELEPDELASLWPVRTAVTPEHVDIARAAGTSCVAKSARRRASRPRPTSASPTSPRAAAAARGVPRRARRAGPH